MTALVTKTERAAAVPAAFWIWGAGGVLAGEFLRLALAHPGLSLAGLVTRAGGERLADLHPHLAAHAASTVNADEAVRALEDALAAEDARAVVVLALPHGQAASTWADLQARLGARAERVHVVDLSADHRLRDSEDYPRWYGAAHPNAAELERFVYGLPELATSGAGGGQAGARIAAPGCFATALQLACVPAARAELLAFERPWIFHGVTGSSGSGKQPTTTTHHPFRDGNLWAYALAGHRHEAELFQALPARPREVLFAPHSGPFVRGIHLTAYLPLARSLETDEAVALFEESYGGRPFVEVLTKGAPELRRVVGSNTVAMSVRVRGELLVVSLVLDNLLKGGSGQALQALNPALGWPETTGLDRLAWGLA